MWSDAYVDDLRVAIALRDLEIAKLQEKLFAAEQAVRELRAMNERAREDAA